MSPKFGQYQQRDWDVVDYESFELPDFPYSLRGPAPVSTEDGNYGLVIGAGQSFGVLVRRPFAHMITAEFGLPVLNLSVGGSSPQLFLGHAPILERFANARFCIVQVLSARSSESSYFESMGGKNMLRPAGSKLPFVPGDTAFNSMFENETELFRRVIVGELRANWIREMTDLLSSLPMPKILMWFSKRKPDFASVYDSYNECAGVFPQFVNRAMIDAVRRHADSYVEVTTRRGMPNKLINRFTGEPAVLTLGDRRERKTEDNYYPSPEMHEDAFALLRPAIATLLNRDKAA